MERKRQKLRRWILSRTSRLHYIKLVYRSLLFLGALVLYIISRVRQEDMLFHGWENKYFLLDLIWLVYVVEMIFRYFPSPIESMGCQKQFARNYVPIDEPGAVPGRPNEKKTTLAVLAAWLALNGLFGVLYFAGIFDRGILLLISLAYSICDMICILFFCPFQTWFMKNRCCTTCRIYNWDFAMMFTPLVFIPGLYTWSLLALALGLLVVWEVLLHRYPERFYEHTNATLDCANCREKLCQHKKQLQRFLKKYNFRRFAGKVLNR